MINGRVCIKVSFYKKKIKDAANICALPIHHPNVDVREGEKLVPTMYLNLIYYKNTFSHNCTFW